MFPLLGYNHLT